MNENVGKILVDSKGRTLYLFERDSGTKSTCTGACAVEWPPLRATDKPTVGSGANASIVATSARSDGKPQVTYNGHPLYLFSADQKAGDTNGQGVNAFGGLWYVLSSTGNQIGARVAEAVWLLRRQRAGFRRPLAMAFIAGLRAMPVIATTSQQAQKPTR